MPTLERREVLEFMELTGAAVLMVAKNTFSLSKFYDLMDALRKFAGNAFKEEQAPLLTSEYSILRKFLRPDGYIDKGALFEQIESELLMRTQNLLKTFLGNNNCHELPKFLLYEENTWNERPMRGFGPKFRNDLKAALSKYGLMPGMSEHMLQVLFDHRWR